MKFYLYEFDDLPVRIKWDYDKFFYNRWCQEAYAALISHPDRVDSEDDADVFVITQTLRTVSFAGIAWSQFLPGHLASKPAWHAGKKHIIFDIKDSPTPMWDDPRMIVCKTAFHEKYFNPAKHISIPQFPRQRFTEVIKPVSERGHLVGFKGHPRSRCTNLRTRLFKLHDGKRAVIESGEYSPETIGPYTDMLRDSKFALLPRADGYALSYRMIESMNLGCIPVVISDGYVLPFSPELDYGKFSIRIPEKDADDLIDILKFQTNLEGLQKNAYDAYSEYFSSTEKIINHTIRMVGGLNA